MSKHGKEYSIQGIKASVFYWMEVPCYAMMIIFTMIFHYDCPSPSVWQWQIGIIGLVLRYIWLYADGKCWATYYSLAESEAEEMSEKWTSPRIPFLPMIVYSNRNYLKTVTSLKSMLILIVKTNTSQKLQFSQKEICRKYYRIDLDLIQCAGNLALSYSFSNQEYGDIHDCTCQCTCIPNAERKSAVTFTFWFAECAPDWGKD